MNDYTKAITPNERLSAAQVATACEVIRTRGGRFARALAELIEASDSKNLRKLLIAFDTELRAFLPRDEASV